MPEMFSLTSGPEVGFCPAMISNRGEEAGAVNEALSSEVGALRPVLSAIVLAGDAGTRPNDFVRPASTESSLVSLTAGDDEARCDVIN